MGSNTVAIPDGWESETKPAAPSAAPTQPEGYTSSAGGYGTEALKNLGNFAGGFV